MKFFSPKEFTGANAWDAISIANMSGITTRLHWTDQPYKWHINDGQEVFVVLNGAVDMHYRKEGIEHVSRMGVGDVFQAPV